ncbi:MAG: tetratricopeptide repeat protein [Hydrotalea sp.]|nr:tetratricopeptide repeat protein [Hydrotalea sp.]
MNSAKIKPDIVIKSLDDYIQWVRKETANMGKPVYRGISWGKDNIEGFKNQPACFRRTDLYDGLDASNWIGFQRELLNIFNNKGHNKARNKERLSELELLAKIQHIENRTALLDYSFNSLIALGFAVSGDKENGLVLINEIAHHKEVDNIKLKKPIKYFFSKNRQDTPQLWYWELPRVDNPRMLAQQALFIFGIDEIPYDRICLIKNPRIIKLQLQKIFDVHETSIYPDFSGLAKYLKIGKEAGFKSTDGGNVSGSGGSGGATTTDLAQSTVTSANPGSVDEYNNHGIAKAKLGKYNEAIKDFDKAIELNPQHAEAYYNRGNAKIDLGQYDSAIKDYNEAIKLNPQHADAYNNRGNAKNGLGQHEEAMADYDKAIELKPQFAEAYNNRGAAKYNLGKHNSAIKDYDKAIELNPQNAEAYNNRGAVKGQVGQFVEAIKDFDKAMELNPKYAAAYNNRGAVKGQVGQFVEAIKDFDKAIELNPQFADAYYNRGITKSSLADEEEAKGNKKRADELRGQAAADQKKYEELTASKKPA